MSWYTRPGFGQAYGSAAISSRGWGWYSFDVTDLVRVWVNGSFPNYGLIVRGSESAGLHSARLGFVTREEEGVTEDPYLEVSYAGTVAATQPPPEQDHAGATGRGARLGTPPAAGSTSKAAADR